MKKLLLSTLMASLVAMGAHVSAADPQPYNFNVYAIHDIGKVNQGYGSDFQGIAGAGGNAYFNNFSGNAVGPAYPYSFYGGGNYTQNSGQINNGGLEVKGNINLSSSAINGNISGGGNLTGGNGQVNGNVSITGTNTSALTINGTTTTGATFNPTMNLGAVTQYFKNASTFWGSQAATATFTNVYGQLQVSNLVSGRNIVNISFADLSASGVYGIKLNGPADAFVVFNVLDSTPNATALKDVTFSLNGGITGTDVLFNLVNATNVTLSGGQYLSILAPNASITFPSGLVTGNLVADYIYGSGQVNQGAFEGFSKDQNNFVAVPEPSTYLILSSFLLAALFWKRRKAAPQIQ